LRLRLLRLQADSLLLGDLLPTVQRVHAGLLRQPVLHRLLPSGLRLLPAAKLLRTELLHGLLPGPMSGAVPGPLLRRADVHG